MRNTSRILLLLVTGVFWLPAYAAPFDADVQFSHRITLSVPVTGEIQQVNVKAGQAINSGDVLIALDKTPFEAAVIQAKSAVTTHETEKRETERDYKQLQELYDRGVLSTVELENGELKMKRAIAAHDAAMARLAQAEYDLAHSTIVAPFNGWVLKVIVNKNETVNSSLETQPLIILAEANKYVARVQVPLKSIGGLKIGKTGTVSVGKKSFKGTIAAVSLEPVSASDGKASYAVDVEFDSNGTLLRAGQTARVEM